MIKEKITTFLSELISINIKEDAETIQQRSILKLYTMFGIVSNLIIFIMFLLDKDYLCAIVSFLYWVLLLVFFRIGDSLSVDISKYVLVITTAIYSCFFSTIIGIGARFDAYFLLIIPIIANIFNKDKTQATIELTVSSILYVLYSIYFVYSVPFTFPSNLTIAIISIVNAAQVFITLLIYSILCNIYNDSTINKLKEDKKTLDKDSKMDHLTGLYNRRSMEKYLDTLEDQYRITNKSFGLILFDIDHFKKVNDTYGHQAGDRVLAEISRLIVYSLRKSDEVFRYGGEEILAIVTGVQTKDDLIKVANGIREDIASLKIPYEDIDISVTISAGATLFDGAEIDTVIKRVDEALYAAKNNGRNKVEYL